MKDSRTRVVWAPLGDLGVCESGDVGGVELLEFDRGAPAQGAVASLPVVEDLQVPKDRVGQHHRVFHRRRSSSSVCIRAQKDSITALSSASPMVPIQGSSSDAPARWVDAQEVNCEP